MRQQASNQIIALGILALLTTANLAYVLLPHGKVTLANDDEATSPETVASIGGTFSTDVALPSQNPALTKQDLMGLANPLSKGADKGSMILQSHFAIIFEPKNSLAEVEAQWSNMRITYADAMDGMMALARISDMETVVQSVTSLSAKLHLAVGPFSNMQDAAYLCVSLQRQGEDCIVSGFSGQPLDVFGQAILNSHARKSEALTKTE